MGGQDLPSSSSSSDRRQWQRIFEALVQMLQSQQSQIATLANDRKFLEEYIHVQHDRWLSKARLLESHISQMKKEEEKGLRVQAAKLDLVVGMKQREALCYKEQCDLAESDVDDFRACVETLSFQISELKEKVIDSKSKEAAKGTIGDSHLKTVESTKEDNQHTTSLEGEIRKLKHAYRKLSSKKETEVSALLAEKDFVWNQFKTMESDYIGILKSKRIEVEQANETIENLQVNLEKFQSSASEKDAIIANLEAERARLDLDMRRHTQEVQRANEKIEKLQLNMEELLSSTKEKDEIIAKLRLDLAKLEVDVTKCINGNSRLSKHLRSRMNSRNTSVTPVGSSRRTDSRKRVLESAKSHVNQKRIRVYEDSSGSRTSGAINGLQLCSKRTRMATTNLTVESPRLFSANFKVPKLKYSSPAIV